MNAVHEKTLLQTPALCYNARMIGIVDYNAGNITSLERALKAIGVEYIRSKNPLELKDAEKIIFPGDGEAKYAMEQLQLSGFDSFLRDAFASGIPVAGICIGSQIVFDWSEEGDTKCLGLIPGKIRHISKLWEERLPTEAEHKEREMLKPYLKAPHMGWNDITFCNGGTRFARGVADHSDFYFVHSYVIQPEDPLVIKGYTNYGTMIPAIVEKDNLTVFQFHPEKSGVPGLKLLENFCNGANVSEDSQTSAGGANVAGATDISGAAKGGTSC